MNNSFTTILYLSITNKADKFTILQTQSRNSDDHILLDQDDSSG